VLASFYSSKKKTKKETNKETNKKTKKKTKQVRAGLVRRLIWVEE
jgi:hypothetical protein